MILDGVTEEGEVGQALIGTPPPSEFFGDTTPLPQSRGLRLDWIGAALTPRKAEAGGARSLV